MQKNESKLLRELLNRSGTRVVKRFGRLRVAEILSRHNIDKARCMGIKPHGTHELCAKFEFLSPVGLIKYDVIYEKVRAPDIVVSSKTENINPRQGPSSGTGKKLGGKKVSDTIFKEPRPWLVFIGAFETNRRRH